MWVIGMMGCSDASWFDAGPVLLVRCQVDPREIPGPSESARLRSDYERNVSPDAMLPFSQLSRGILLVNRKQGQRSGKFCDNRIIHL
jgi:hypothetical protein